MWGLGCFNVGGGCWGWGCGSEFYVIVGVIENLV